MEDSTWLTPLRGIALLATLLVVAPAAASSAAWRLKASASAIFPSALSADA